MKQEKIFIVVIALFYSCISTVLQAQTEITTVFERETDGYACFRIPAIVRTEKGTLLAFAEGRKDNCADTGNIDVVLRRSADDGTSWEPLQVVWDAGEDVCGNPVPIVDRRTGRIHLIVCWNRAEDREAQLISGESRDKRHVYTLYSDDEEKWAYDISNTNFSVNVGAGVTLMSHLEIGFTYNIACGKTGEVNVWDVASSTWNQVTKGRANAWQVSAAYYF